MITIDEVFPVDIRASIGPAGTIKRLFSNTDFFRSHGYEMTIFANHFSYSRGLRNFYELREMTELPSADSYQNFKGNESKKRIVSKLKQHIVKSKLMSYCFVKYKRDLTIENLIRGYIARNREPDILVFHGYAECAYYFKWKTDINKSKVVLFLHSDGQDISMEYKSYPKLVGTKLYQKKYEDYIAAIGQADRVVHISKLASRAFATLHPDYPKEKLYTVVNGIDERPLLSVSPSANFRYRMCSSGSVCQRKGQYIIIEAMNRMNKDVFEDFHLTIMGSGPDFDNLVEKVGAYGLKEHVTFLGNVPNPQMHELLSAENIYCLMSNNEGLPIAILEAMRAGLPVIATKVAGIPEQVDERNGFLINPSVDELLEIINNIPNVDWAELGKKSRERFETEFRFERMLEDYVAVFDSLKI